MNGYELKKHFRQREYVYNYFEIFHLLFQSILPFLSYHHERCQYLHIFMRPLLIVGRKRRSFQIIHVIKFMITYICFVLAGYLKNNEYSNKALSYTATVNILIKT